MDEDGVRDDLRDYVVEHLGDPEGVLVVDETGDLKKGTATVGTQRQYTGTAGRIENAQVAVYLAYASQAGHAVVDRELYVPQGWISDPDRCRAVGVPAQVGFLTKPALAGRMLARALDAGVPAAWVAGDEVYGADPALRAELETRGIGYVLAVACDHPVQAGGSIHRADGLLGWVPARAWQQGSCGPGAKGHRYYDWAFIRLDDGGAAPSGQGQHWLLVRRWRSWYRWTTLAMLAHTFLVVAATTDQARGPTPGLVKLTCNEVQHLFAALVAVPAADAGHRLRWSVWRRRHQARARTSHYRRQANGP